MLIRGWLYTASMEPGDTDRVAEDGSGTQGDGPPAYINDQWTLALEELGFEREAEQLARMILSCRPPFAVCIAGRWGSGKTSVMRYAMTLLGGDTTRVRLPLQADSVADESFGGGEKAVARVRKRGVRLLRKQNAIALAQDGELSDGELADGELAGSPLARDMNRVATLWFSPWRHQNEDNPMVPLLRSLREQLSTWARMRNWVSKKARALCESGLEIIGHLADSAAVLHDAGKPAFGAVGAALDRVRGKSRDRDVDALSEAERFHLLFERAIRSVLGVVDRKDDGKGAGADGLFSDSNNHRLVIFIDDLDRCEGPACLRLLEAIKLYLSTRYCVFVLGLDVPAAESALRSQWERRPPGMAREYLDKLFQSYVHMPHSARYPLFIHNRLSEWRLIASDVIEPADYPASEAHDTARVLAEILPANPRKVKNFLNSLALAWEVARQGDDTLAAEGDLLGFALVQRLRVLSPRVFTLLCQDPEEQLPVLQRFFEQCVTRREYQLDRSHAVLCAALVNAFRHMVALDDSSWQGEPLAPALGLRDIDVGFESVAADRGLARRWIQSFGPDGDAAPSSGEFRRYAGLGARSAP